MGDTPVTVRLHKLACLMSELIQATCAIRMADRYPERLVDFGCSPEDEPLLVSWTNEVRDEIRLLKALL